LERKKPSGSYDFFTASSCFILLVVPSATPLSNWINHWKKQTFHSTTSYFYFSVHMNRPLGYYQGQCKTSITLIFAAIHDSQGHPEAQIPWTQVNTFPVTP